MAVTGRPSSTRKPPIPPSAGPPCRGSLSPHVGRWKRILDRLERVLGQAERFLESRAGAEPQAALFERASAFRWDARRGAGRLRPIERPQLFHLDDLVGVDRAKGRLIANTEQFLAALP